MKDPDRDEDDAPETELTPETLAAFPLERWARICFMVDAAPEDEPEILAANGLGPRTWEELHDHWLGVQEAELARGRTTTLEGADGAYLARMEETRGALTVEDYAQIVTSSERGDPSATLAQLEIPEGAVVVVERVWLRRCAVDAALAGATEEAISRARAPGLLTP